MKLKTNSFAFRFFAVNLFVPFAVHVIFRLLLLLTGIDLRVMIIALMVIMLINAINLTMAWFYKGWERVGLLVITAFNLLALFAMGALSFFTSVVGWPWIVPEVVAYFTGQ